MIHFTKSNWERFFTHEKVSTIRAKPKKLGLHKVGVGFRKIVGEVEVTDCRETQVYFLTENEAKNDGFNDLPAGNLAELLLELGKLNHDLHADSHVFVLTCCDARDYEREKQ